MMLLSSRASRAGIVLAIVAVTACNDDSNLLQAPQHARRDVSAGTTLLVTNTSGGSVAGSLRAVINQTAGGETIHFDPSLAGAKIVLDTTLDVPQNVTIEGPIDKGVTISGGGKSTVMVVHRGATLVNLTITEGQAKGNNPAGGILDTGVLIVKNSTIAGNHGFNGGGIEGDFIAASRRARRWSPCETPSSPTTSS